MSIFDKINLHMDAKPVDQDVYIKLKNKDITAWCVSLKDQWHWLYLHTHKTHTPMQKINS